MLPPLVFNSGFSMRRKKFFENIGNIIIFGLFVTLVCFAIYSAGGFLVMHYIKPKATDFVSNVEQPVNYSMLQLMLFTSLLCSSDVVAAVSIVDYEAAPKLYSCIFGEGVFNDIVSIVLFNVVNTLQGKEFTAAMPFVILAQFVSLAVISVAFGIIFGFATALLFKHFRFLTISCVIETFVMLAMGFTAYYVAEAIIFLGLDMSGIIALLTCSIIQSHYTWYNLSPQGKSTTAVTFAFLGHTAEAAIYCYVGLSLYSSIAEYWSIVWCVF